MTTFKAKYLMCRCEYCEYSENTDLLLKSFNNFCDKHELKNLPDKYCLVNLLMCNRSAKTNSEIKLPAYQCVFDTCDQCPTD